MKHAVKLRKYSFYVSCDPKRGARKCSEEQQSRDFHASVAPWYLIQMAPVELASTQGRPDFKF